MIRTNIRNQSKHASHARFLCSVSCLLCAGFFSAGPFSLIATTVAKDLESVTVRQFNGSSAKGTVSSLDENGELVGDDFPTGVRLSEVLSIESDKAVSIDPNLSVILHLVDGGKIRIKNPQIADEKVIFRSGSGISEIPLQALRAIVWSGSATVERQVANPAIDKDGVIVGGANGEQGVAGIMESLNLDKLHLSYEGKSETIDVGKLKALVMADLGLKRLGGSIATISLIDGSTVVGVISNIANRKVSVSQSGNTTIEFPTNKIASLVVESDRLQYLSDLEPTDVQQRTQFALQREWKRDRSVETNPLRIRFGKSDRISQFHKGLGTQAFTELSFTNAKNFDRFNATVGIDAETQGRGDCRMVLRGDGIELWSKRVRGDGDPEDVDVEIAGMKVISLVVYPGEDFDLADHADWANARFVRTK